MEAMQKPFEKEDGTFEIKPDMIISDVLEAFPRVAQVFMSYGLHCVGCAANAFDTVEGGAKLHGMPDEEIAKMISEANVMINKNIETIELTEKAIQMVKQLRAEEKGKEGWPLRVAIVDIQPQGFQYDMDFDQKKDGDTEFEFEGLTVLVDKKSYKNLQGSSIDYVDSMAGSGFKIDNPNTPRACQCGKHPGGACGC